jgi:hypothetical protein
MKRALMLAPLLAVLIFAVGAALPQDAAHQAAADVCAQSVPVIVPIVVTDSAHVSGTFTWASSSCGTISGSWTNAPNGTGTFSWYYNGKVTGQWSAASGGGSFDYGCVYCDHTYGSWSLLPNNSGSFTYNCNSCNRVRGSWSAFSGGSGSFNFTCDTCSAVVGTWVSDSQRGSFNMSDGTAGQWNWTAATATPTPSPTSAPSPTPAPTSCISTVGPGMPPPSGLTTGIDGLHAAWYGQSGYMTLCPGTRATAVVAYLNTGSIGWVAGAPGQTALLGTWDPVPGQDQPSVLGGDGTNGSPNTGWPSYNRPAAQPASYVGPGQVAWFQFTVQAPMTPGTYRLALRPLIEGVQWLEDYGVFWYVTAKSS